MICTKCYHLKSCYRKPSLDDRCGYYLKKGKVKLDDSSHVNVNPMDTSEIDIGEIVQSVERVQ